jgi:glyoxylase-like metal-dependent hydrolase (beta-lactamase superfamily II)
MQIIPLSEGRFTIDATKIFIPFDEATDDLMQRPAGSLLVEIQPFLLICGEKYILLDTGLGFRDSTGRLQIHSNLLNNGIDPSRVDMVILSHLHKDHAGGIMDGDKPAFENAVYYINRNEMDMALEKGFPSYDIRQFEKLPLYHDIQWLQADGHINEFIRFETCGGHCPYHMALWFSEEDQTAFFGGDVAPQLQQMKTRYITKYDSEPRKSMELRTMWWKEAQEKKWTMLFYHDIRNPYVRL